MRKQKQTNWIGCPRGVLGTDSLAGQPLGKLAAIAMVLGLLTTGLVVVLVPEEAGGDDYDMSHVVSMWIMDEGAGTTAYDETVNDNDGTVHGANWGNGVHNSGLEFDGLDDYVSIPNDDSLKFGDGPFSVEAWIKTNNDNPGFEWIISKHNTANWHDEDYGLAFHWDSKGIIFFELSDGTGYFERAFSTTNVADGNWHHIAGVRNDTHIMIFIDGELENSTTATINTDNDEPVNIGRTSYRNGLGYFNGSIDEVVLHNKALEPSEFYGLRFMNKLIVEPSQPTYFPGDLVTLEYMFSGGQANISSLVRGPDGKVYLMETIATSPYSDITDGLVGYWPFDEGSDDTAVDASGNGNNGTLNGPVWTDGINGDALEFDGEDDYVEIPYDESFNSGTITIGAWINPIEWAAGGSGDDWCDIFICKGFDNTEGSYWIGRYGSYDEFYFAIRSDDDVTYEVRSEEKFIEIDRWYHLVGTYDGNTLTIYVNGELKNTNIINMNLPDYNEKIKIGWHGMSGYRYAFNGIIDDPIVYSRALSADEIATLYNNTLEPNNHTATLTFRLPSDAPLGTWTVYATNDRGGSKANITFEVVAGPPPPKLSLELGTITDVRPGETVTIDFIVTNGFDTSRTFLLALQLKDPSRLALRPDIKEGLTINATDQRTWQLSVTIPTDAEVGTYFLQGQMFTDWPDDRGGYVLDYNTTTVTVTAA